MHLLCGPVRDLLSTTYIIIRAVFLGASTSMLATIALTASVTVLLLLGSFLGPTLAYLGYQSLLLLTQLVKLLSLSGAEGKLA